MTQWCRGRYEVRAVLSASLDSIEDFVNRTRPIWQQAECHQNDFATELLLRETLTNAVVHGCHEDPGRRVSCVLRLNRCRLFFAVRDDGIGFDWHSAWHRQSASVACSGRGIEILQRYASRVRFNRTGNQVAIAKHLG